MKVKVHKIVVAMVTLVLIIGMLPTSMSANEELDVPTQSSVESEATSDEVIITSNYRMDFALQSPDPLDKDLAITLANVVATQGGVPIEIDVNQDEIDAINAATRGIELPLTFYAGGISKVVYVIVFDFNNAPVTSGGVTTFADPFTITIDEASSITEEAIIEKSNAIAYKGGQVVPVGLAPGKLADLRQVTEECVMPMYYTGRFTGGSATKGQEIIVIDPDYPPSIEGISTIFGRDFVLEVEEASTLSVEKAIEKSKAKAYSDQYLMELEAKAEHLTAINNTTYGTILPLTWMEFWDEAEKTVKVTIIDKENPPIIQGDLTLFASNFSINRDDLTLLSHEKVIELAHAQGFDYLNTIDVDVDTTQFTTLQQAEIQTSLPITFYAGGLQKEVVVTIKDPLIGEDRITLLAENYELQLKDLQTHDIDAILTHAQVRAFQTEDGSVLDVSVDASTLQSATSVGVYEVILSATLDDVTKTKTIYVSVIDESVEKLGDYYISAYDFTVDMGDSKRMHQPEIMEAAKAKAWNGKTGEDLSGQLVTYLDAIIHEATYTRTYDAEFYIVDCIQVEGSPTKTIKATVLDTTPPKVDVSSVQHYGLGATFELDYFLYTIGYRPIDDSLGEITTEVYGLEELDMTTLGTYEVKISSKDETGNETISSINIIVHDRFPVHTITFDLGEYGKSEDLLTKYITYYHYIFSVPNVIANEGYEFSHWTLNGVEQNPEDMLVLEDMTFVAVYKKDETIVENVDTYYDVVFVLPKHSSSTDSLHLSIKQGDRITSIPKVEVEEGYTFVGWTINGTDMVDPSQIEVTESIIFQAVLKDKSGNIVTGSNQREMIWITPMIAIVVIGGLYFDIRRRSKQTNNL